MPFSDPDYASTLGDAKLVRHVHVPALAKSFLVWTYADGVNDRFAAKAYDAPMGSDVALTEPLFPIQNFHVIDMLADGEVLFLFDDGTSLWQMIVDLGTDAIVLAPEVLYTGTDPSALYDGLIRMFYLKNNNLMLRNGIAGVEQDLSQMTSMVILDQDVEKKGSVHKARYAGKHTPAGPVALPLRVEANTYVLYRDTLIDVGGTDYLKDLSPTAKHAEISGVSVFPGIGTLFNTGGYCRLVNWVVPAAMTIEAWFVPNFRAASVGYILKTSNLNLTYNNERMLSFDFTGTVKHTFTQSAGLQLLPDQPNHVVVSHVFGAMPLVTFMTINGKEVWASWTSGNGTESPSFGALTSTIELGWQDILQEFRISTVAKSQSDILDYIRGRV
jgi:hypothetical protein